MSAKSLMIINSFLNYAEKNGLELLEDDKRLIRCIATAVEEKPLRDALDHYLRDWKHGAAMEESEIKKTNAGRRLANTKFRERLGFNGKYKY